VVLPAGSSRRYLCESFLRCLGPYHDGLQVACILAVGNLALFYRPVVDLFGFRFRLFDVGGVVGLAGLILTVALDRAEPLAPKR